MRRFFTAGALILFLPICAHARETGTGVTASGMGGVIHRELTVGLDAFFLAWSGGLRIAVGAPLRFDSKGLRHEDWDEVPDFGRIVAEVAYGKPGDRLHLRLGTISGYTLGVGDLVSHHYSTVDLDHWHTGFMVALDGEVAGGEAFVDSILAPELAATRAYVRPFATVDRGGFFGRLELGGTVVGDFRAPWAMERKGGAVAIDSDGLPESDREVLAGTGADIRWPVIKSESVEVVPYFAFSHVRKGIGTHLGLAIEVSPVRDVRLGLVGEWKWMGAGYASPYFDSLYAIDRHDFSGPTKAGALTEAGDSRHGVRAGISFSWARYVSWWGLLDLDWEDRFTGLRAGLELRPVKGLAATVNVTERGLRRASSIFDPDRCVIVTALDWSFHKNIAIFGTYTRDVMVARSGDNQGHWIQTDTGMGGIRITFSQ